MTRKIESPATAPSGTGLPDNIVQLGGFEQGQNSREARQTQGRGSVPLFNARTRDDALHTANELNAAAKRCRLAAREHPGATGQTLDRLAGHYAGMARDWFGRAESLPSFAGAVH